MLELIIAGLMAGALVLYALLGGADYGGGVWDLFAAPPSPFAITTTSMTGSSAAGV